MSKRIIYSRGFPYGAPLVMLRGGATKDSAVRDYLKSLRFMWNPQRFAWENYMYKSELVDVLLHLRDELGCEVIPKTDIDPSYVVDLPVKS